MQEEEKKKIKQTKSARSQNSEASLLLNQMNTTSNVFSQLSSMFLQ